MMTEVKAALPVMLFALAKLCRFNAFAGAFCGIAYGLIASTFDRVFFGLGPTQIALLGAACFVVFFASSIGLTVAGNSLVSDVESPTNSDSQA
jgi:hypothetical protein